MVKRIAQVVMGVGVLLMAQFPVMLIGTIWGWDERWLGTGVTLLAVGMVVSLVTAVWLDEIDAKERREASYRR